MYICINMIIFPESDFQHFLFVNSSLLQINREERFLIANPKFYDIRIMFFIVFCNFSPKGLT